MYHSGQTTNLIKVKAWIKAPSICTFMLKLLNPFTNIISQFLVYLSRVRWFFKSVTVHRLSNSHMFLLIIAEVNSPGSLTDDPLQTLSEEQPQISISTCTRTRLLLLRTQEVQKMETYPQQDRLGIKLEKQNRIKSDLQTHTWRDAAAGDSTRGGRFFSLLAGVFRVDSYWSILSPLIVTGQPDGIKVKHDWFRLHWGLERHNILEVNYLEALVHL